MATELPACLVCGRGATSDKRQMKEVGVHEIESPICLRCWPVKALEIFQSKRGNPDPPSCHCCRRPMELRLTVIDMHESVSTYAPVWTCSDGRTTLAFGTTSERLKRIPSRLVRYFLIALVTTVICGTIAYLVQENYPDPPKVFTGEFETEVNCRYDGRVCGTSTVPVYRTIDVGYPMGVWALKVVAFFCFFIAIAAGITAIVQVNSLWRVWKNMATK